MRGDQRPKGFKPPPRAFLFLPRLVELFSTPPFSDHPDRYKSTMFLTPPPADEPISDDEMATWAEIQEKKLPKMVWGVFDRPVDPVETRFGRLQKRDLERVVGDDMDERAGVVAYVCGPPKFTDWVIEEMGSIPGVDKERVLCEKWW